MSETQHSPGAAVQAPGSPYFRPLPAQVDLPAVEHEVLKRWADSAVFDRSLEQSQGRPPWVFFEGPPTANGMPGVHHVEARVFKDLFPRFKTMKGFHVPRKAGWDCHGLPVEVAVEKELGLSGKKDIEAYGVAQFNDRCRESVLRHVDAFEAMTERMGYWVDMSQAYRTMDPAYVESVWWSLKVIWDKGLLVRDHRISPYCPRCGTPLSDHELGQPGAYETVEDPSVTVRFPLRGGPVAEHPALDGADLLIWTTTPWTLVTNTAIAVHPDVTYVVAGREGERPVVLAEPLMESVLGASWTVLDRLLGRELERAPYRRPLELVEIPNAHFVVLADFVSTEDGTGLVHMAPAFGADDNAATRAYGMPMVNPIGPDGRFADAVPMVGGMFFKDADPGLVEAVRERGMLFHSGTYEHSYPHCWRCHTPLLYYALPSWYIKTTSVKDALLRENERTNWVPPNIKEGRYGEWLRNNVDWALSRSRYWGTPLPLWVCEADHVTCVGSLAELGELAGRDLSALDPHRPYVDDVTFGCRHLGKEGLPCQGTARRVPEVIDVWYDSGAMPFAQWGAPHRNAGLFETAYPGQFISEAIDQTRGWFYSMMAIGTLVFDRSSYENVVCLGHILAEDGRKMSKHLGNVLEPMPLMERHGADALRWYMAAGGSPWLQRRVGHGPLEEIVRKVLLTYWNTASFFVLYANAGEGWSPSRLGEAPAYGDRPAQDRWVLSELHRTVAEADAALEEFDTARAGRSIAGFIDDLSNWYVRRSRRRFWAGPGTPEGASAFATLYECLDVVTRMMAPITPFLTDYVWDVVRAPSAPESVHLAAWPEARESLVDDRLAAQMALVRRLVELGRAARAESGMRTRQPLARAVVGAAGFAGLSEELRAQVADELNVGSVGALADVEGDLVDFEVKPNFRALGKRFGKQTPLVAEVIAKSDAAGLVAALRSDGSVTVHVPELGDASLGPDDVIVTERPREGWTVAAEGGETVALDLELTPELRRAGLAREVVRLLQDARKGAGLDISDRIEVWWESANGDVVRSLRENTGLISSEVLAAAFTEGRPQPTETRLALQAAEIAGLAEQYEPGLGLHFWLRRTP
ncbi:MAG: isoleucine--tRNA ligase [Streptosporangiales bacterium]|nr:isoleucine--tRNA ligase [Streptosporangiales bacterium]